MQLAHMLLFTLLVINMGEVGIFTNLMIGPVDGPFFRSDIENIIERAKFYHICLIFDTTLYPSEPINT